MKYGPCNVQTSWNLHLNKSLGKHFCDSCGNLRINWVLGGIMRLVLVILLGVIMILQLSLEKFYRKNTVPKMFTEIYSDSNNKRRGIEEEEEKEQQQQSSTWLELIKQNWQCYYDSYLCSWGVGAWGLITLCSLLLCIFGNFYSKMF